MPITLHQVTPANANLLAAVDPDVFDHPIQPARLAAYLADPLHAMFVVVEHDRVVGHIRGSIHLQPDRASDLYIDNLGVAPAYQRRGLASLLIDTLVKWGETQGCTHAWVATETDNDGALGFYGTLGFARDTIAMFSSTIGDPED